jgi:hypothetical protein
MSDNFVDYEIEEEMNNTNNNNTNNININNYVKELEAEREDLYNRIDELLKNNNNNMYNNIKNSGNVAKIISLFWTLVTFYAIYLSFKCNNGFNILGFLGALIFSPFYIAYKLGTHWDVCMGSSVTGSEFNQSNSM